MIGTRSGFPSLAAATSRGRVWTPRNKRPSPFEPRELPDDLLDRQITIEAYLDQPRLRSPSEELAATRKELERLRGQLAVARHRNDEESELAPILVETIGRIVELSERLFPGPVSFEYSFDPENPSDEWLVFDVVAQGHYADYRDREFKWHEEVERIVPGTLGEFRLCVMPQR